MAVLWKSQGLFCRRTVCYRIRDPADGKEYAMKDCWVAEVKRFHEVDVLERVKGIPNVVQLIDHWDVLFSGEPDCTARIRDRYGILPEDRPDKKFINRYHQRLLLTPCGDPLWDFSSRKELLCAFCDFVVSIGYFIDFDHVSIMKEGETFTISFGTGTVPYISMRILKTMSKNADILKKSRLSIIAKNSANTNSIAQLKLVEHNPSDDLESLFYIFFEFVSKYGGAHGAVAPTWDKMKNLGVTSGLLATFLAKKGAMSESDILMDSVSDYFVEFKPIIDEWRDRIYRMESNPDGAVVHDHIFQMLVKFISNLDDEEPAPLPSPEASPGAPNPAPPGAPPPAPPMLPLVPQVVLGLLPWQDLRSIVH
ncbi:hypothetical protein DFH29DRAFT_996658 [Suillus ampliporus]|nr:hypothetical protein DFH29DRAFT_996658 [Suillus ampliporus]